MAATKLRNTVLFNNANLKALYEFESGALTTDSSGNGKTLTNNNTATEGTGKYGGGAVFNGTDESLTIAEDFGIGTTNWTLSVWAKPSSSSQVGGVVALGNGGSNGFSIYQGNGSGSAGNKIDGHLHGVVWLPSGVDWTGTDFNHVVMTRDTTTTRIYVNGVHRNSTTATPGAPNDVFEIGKMNTGYWAGSIDEVAIFSTALSADQIKELYEGRFIGESYPQAGLVAGWHLNGSSTDFSGNNNHGTDTAITYSQANGKFGQGASNSANPGTVNFGSSSIFNFTTGDFSLSYWIKQPTTLASNWSLGRSSWPNTGWYVEHHANRSVFIIPCNAGDWDHLDIAASALPADVWNQFVVTKSGTTFSCYINGNYISQAALQNPASHTGNLVLTFPTTGGQLKIDEVLIFNRALTSQEIRRMYAVGVGKLQ